MRSVLMEGWSRLIGKDQGYLGLPIRDVIIECSVNGEGTPVMVTHWMPSADEIEAINHGFPIEVSLIGRAHPPIMVGVALENGIGVLDQ